MVHYIYEQFSAILGLSICQKFKKSNLIEHSDPLRHNRYINTFTLGLYTRAHIQTYAVMTVLLMQGCNVLLKPISRTNIILSERVSV